MSEPISLNSQNRYEIKVYGQVDNSWLALFGKAKVHSEILDDNRQVTTFSDVVTDQSGLGGASPYPHYTFIATVETVCLLLIIWNAWKWTEQGA